MDYKDEFEEISNLLKNYNNHPTTDLNEIYICLIKASFTKCVEFNVFLQNDIFPQNSFFYTPFLRGICEDLITLKYLRKYFITDRDGLLRTYMQYLVYSSSEAQTAFFDKTVPSQISPRLKSGSNIVKTTELELKEIMTKNGFNKQKIFPSVEHMAIDGHLKHLYDFFYHATSRMVHFSPNILLRMGWYNSGEDETNDPIVFSSHNFHRYYEQFNKFYAAFLFIEISTAFKTELGLDKSFKNIVKKLQNKFTRESFYPELVTFEELNQKRPVEFIRNFIRLMSEKEL